MNILQKSIAVFIVAIGCAGCVCFDSDNKIQVFNGKNLDGWDIFFANRKVNENPNNLVSVKNGELVFSGKEFGGIATKTEFENFRIVVEYKWRGDTHADRKTKARDSGLLFASKGEFGSCYGAWINSLEVNIIEGATGDFILAMQNSDDFTMVSEVNSSTGEYQKGGLPIIANKANFVAIRRIGRDANWQDKINAKDLNNLEKGVGQWNRLECVFKNGEVDVFLNGVFVNHLDNYFPRVGKLQLQSEGAGIVFRKVEIQPL